MADCDEVLRELQTYLDGELSSQAHSGIQRHLDGCPDCGQVYDFHAELRIVIKARCRSDEVPHGLIDRIQSCFGLDDRTPPGGATGYSVG